MGDVYDPGRDCCYYCCDRKNYHHHHHHHHQYHHSLPVYLFGLLLLASLSVVSSARPLRYTLPRFLDTPNNITAVIGSDVLLPCSVENLGTKSVIWKKVTQYNPIAIGEDIFAPESRYQVSRQDLYMTRDRNDHRMDERNPIWNLKITNVAMQDAGVYECQISTKEDIMRVVTLHVVEDKSHRKLKKTGIKLSGTDFVEKGSNIKLNCTATSIDYRPKGVDWFKDGSRIKVTGRTLINEYLESDTNVLHSRLEVRRAQMEDAGTYVCRFSQSHVESIKVIVLNTDSSNKRRGTDVEGIERDRDPNSVGQQPPFTSQTSRSNDRYQEGWRPPKNPRTREGHQGQSKDPGGEATALFPKTQVVILSLCVFLLTSHLMLMAST